MYKCILCGFEAEDIPEFKENECPKNIQHSFKQMLGIKIITSKEEHEFKLFDGDTLDIVGQEKDQTDIFLEYNYPTLTLKNDVVIKKERGLKS